MPRTLAPTAPPLTCWLCYDPVGGQHETSGLSSMHQTELPTSNLDSCLRHMETYEEPFDGGMAFTMLPGVIPSDRRRHILRRAGL